MPVIKEIRIIIDTNLFISFLIGRQLKKLKDYIFDSKIILIFAEQNILEIELVSKRPKFKKYFSVIDVKNLLDLIQVVGEVYEISSVPEICRDPKDNFLLGLAEKANANYLLTGDMDLLVLKKYKNTKIVTIGEFEQIMGNIAEDLL